METSLDCPQTGAEQIAALRAELDHRNATIDLLAKQLEEAANRLDWINRCGSDSEAQSSSSRTSESPSAGGLESETSDRLNRFLEQWEGTGVGESLERIDRRLSHILEVLKSRDSEGVDPPNSESSASVDVSAEPAAGSLLTAFLRAQSAEPLEQKPDQPTSTETVSSTSDTAADRDMCWQPLPDFTVPQPVDLATASVEVLRSAVIERDECIHQLLARSRISEANRTIVPDWSMLANAPEDLRQRVSQLELDLQQRIKQEELSSSIERAKLFRDRVHLDQVRRELEGQIRKLGQTQQTASSDSQDADRKPAATRWGKMFGR